MCQDGSRGEGVLSGVVRESQPGKATFEQRPEGDKGRSHVPM